MLVFLDLAAFATVDHKFLITCLEQWVGFRGLDLGWFKPIWHVKHSLSAVAILDFLLFLLHVEFLMVQYWGLLFSPYLLLFSSFFRKHRIPFHCYAVDRHIYLPLNKNDILTARPLFDRLNEIWVWLYLNVFSF